MDLAAYARYSTDMQRHESIDAQMRAINEYCAARGHKVVAEFCDEAISGKSVNKRPAFMRMLAAARRHEFDGIIVYYLSRLSRSLEDHVLLERDLGKLGVPILSVKEPDGDTPNGRMVRGIMQVLSQHESEQIGERVAYGMKESALQGKFLGGVVPIGYRVVDGYYAIDDAEAEAVHGAFEMYADGGTLAQILEMFDARGIVGRRSGEPYTKAALYEVLRNRKYLGEYSFNRGTHGDHRSVRADGETIITRDGMPRIVDDVLWQSVQDRNAHSKARHNSARARRPYALTGLSFCAECGAPMIGTPGPSRKEGERYHYYRCSAALRKQNGCRQLAVNAEVAEARVLAALDKHVFEDNSLDSIAEAYHAMLIDASSSARDSIGKIIKRLKAVDIELQNVATAISAAGALPTLIEAVQSKEREKAHLQSHLAAQKKSLSRTAPSADFIRRELVRLRDRLTLAPGNEKALINALVKRIEIKNDKSNAEIIVHVEFVIAGTGSGDVIPIWTMTFAA